jgi:Asp/Glu/hydantoin racemase
MNTSANTSKKDHRVALVSSTRAVFASMERAFREAFPEAQFLHILDETLLENFRQDGGISPRSRLKALKMAITAQESGVNAILVTCSTLSPSVDDFRPFLSIPVVKIDEPVIEWVVQSSRSVALVATADTVLKSVEPLVLEKAGRSGRKVSISRVVKKDLWPLLAKDPAAFYREIGEAAAKAAKECEAVILTQVSIAPGLDFVDPAVRGRVYASPLYAVRELRRILESRAE